MGVIFRCSAVSDVDSDHKVGRHEFADFIFHMAAADLAHSSQPQQEVQVCPSVKVSTSSSRSVYHVTTPPDCVLCKRQNGCFANSIGLHMPQGTDAQPEAGGFDSQKTLSDLFDEGDLAAGLQAWLRLTNNSISGLNDDVCIADADENT